MIYTSSLPKIDIPNGNVVAHWLESAQVKNNLDRPMLVDNASSETLLAKDVINGSLRLAALLQDRYNISKDDVVCLFAFNSIFHQPFHYAVLALGAFMSPANVMYTPEELAHQMRVADPKLIVAAPETYRTAQEAVKITGKHVAVIDYSALCDDIRALIGDSSARSIEPVEVDGENQHAYYCFSSGTTGLPKAVITTHRNITSQVYQVVAANNLFFRPKSTTAAVLPFSHIYGLTAFLWGMTYQAQTLVVFPKFEFTALLKGICEHDIAYCPLVPPIAVLLGKSPETAKYPLAKHLKAILSAAAPLAESTAKLCCEQVEGLQVLQTYGLTESSPFTHAVPGSLESKYANSIGWLLPNVEARLVDAETGKDATRGELWVRGPNIMKGYLHNKEATESTINCDGWLMTGDVAVVDEVGQFYIVDRIKELIKSKGHQVAPAELEAILLCHPSVNDVAVIGIKDEEAGTELPRAFVVLSGGGSESAKTLEVLSWFNNKVAKHKRLWGGIVVVDAVPKSPSGKILRRLLRDRHDDTIYLEPVEPKARL